MKHLEIKQGTSPVVLGFPHTGTMVPRGIMTCLNDNGNNLTDTDWHIHKLYDDLLADLTTVRTLIHRYAIDVNRSPEDQSLYPGKNTTGLCPTTDFDGKPIYLVDKEPDQSQIQCRQIEFHQPYHDALQTELDRVKDIFGFVILFDCHSIRSKIPFLFEATLPDFNIGTNTGTTCDLDIEATVVDICDNADNYSHILNGRFKGGWTTRHYGRPEINQHVVQMELAQSTYMQEKPPWSYDPSKADRLRIHLKTILTALSDWRPS